MSSFSHYLEERIYRWLVLAEAMPTAPMAVYLGLSTADPTDDGSGLAEPGSAYARQSVTFAAPQSTVGQGLCKNQPAVDLLFQIMTETRHLP